MGSTYCRVVELLKREFGDKKVTKYAFCKKTGINPTSLERYLYGISEPTQISLQKLSDYFGVSVAWLRGEDTKNCDEVRENNIDLELLERIVNTVEDFLKGDGTYDIPKEKKVELIKLLYGKYSEEKDNIQESECLRKVS
jgi:transcriptional regulator with XRE-family HTH domain